MPNVSGLVKKANYDAEIKDFKNKYFNTSDYNKFTNNILDAKIIRKKLVKKNVFITLVTKEEIKKLAKNADLKAEQDKKS